MAINVATVQANVRAGLKTAFAAEFGEAESFYDTIAGIFSDEIVVAILDEVKDNADVVGVTSGSDTVVGGVD